MPAMVAHILNPSIEEAEAGELCEAKASLVYMVLEHITLHNLETQSQNKEGILYAYQSY